MSLTKVEVTSEVFWTCCNHALSTEAEEIMGLLLGDVTERPNCEVVARIWIAMPQIRSDRRKDRVEASPEQLSRCAAAAEQFTSQGGVRTRVIGWYHSHPHITVLPSHVDIKTQATYQMLDDGFVGLIFSTFNQDPKDKSQSITVTAFQSVAANEGLSPSPSFMAGRLPSMDADMAQAIQLSLAEARHQASADSVQWQRKGVPLHIVQSKGPMERTLTDLVALAKVLYQEEQKAFHAAMAEATDRDGNIDPLAAVQHAAMYQQNLSRLLELVVSPMLRSMHTSLSQQQLRKQCGHLANNVYSMQLPNQAGTPESQTLAQLSASMAELLESPKPEVGKGGLVPQQSGVSSMGAESWDPSEALQMHQTQQLQHHQQLQQQQPHQQQQQYQQQPHHQLQQQQQQPHQQLQQQQQQHQQQQQMQPQSLVLPEVPPVFQLQEQQQMPQSPFHAHAASQHQSESQFAAPQQVAHNGFSNSTGQEYFHQSGPTQLHQAQFQAPGSVNVSIISPAIWAATDRQSAQPSHAGGAWQGSQQQPSAPLAGPGALHAAYPASNFDPGSEHHSTGGFQQPPLQEMHPQHQQQQQQQFLHRPTQLSPRPPLAGRDSKRSIATNTQLTMHRGNPDMQKPSSATAEADGTVTPGSAAQAFGLTGAPAQDSGSYVAATSSAGLASAVGSGHADVQNQPMLHASNSTGNLSAASSLDGLEKRNSGQLPMRAGSPALGGRAFPKPPSWSSKDPFGDLATSDFKNMARTDSNASR